MTETMKEKPDLWTLAAHIATPTDADQFFVRLLGENQKYDDPGVKSLFNRGIRSLMENSTTEPKRARAIIEKYILGVCLRRESSFPPELLSEHDAREILSHWIEQFPDESRIPLRAALMARVADILESSPSVASIKTLASFGLRSQWVERTLVRFLDRKDPIGVAAINGLCSLSPTRALRARLIRAVIEHAQGDSERTLSYAIQELASPRLIPLVRDYFLSNDPDLWKGPFLLGRIADRAPGDGQLQSRVWHVFEEFMRRDPGSSYRVVAIGNTLANCNTPHVVKYVLVNIGTPQGINPHSAFNLLKDCYRPSQLAGWKREQVDLKTRLKKFATLPASPTASVSPPDMLRRAAWEIAFCAGIVSVSDWLSPAAETSPIAVAEMLTYVSFTVSPDWPPIVERLVAETVDLSRGGDLFLEARIAAARMLAATESLRALDVLLNCGLNASGAPLYSMTTPTADLAERCSIRSGSEVVERLLAVCEDQTRGAVRMAAILGLQRLAAHDRISPMYLDRILALSRDDSLPSYALPAVIWILGSLTGADVDAIRADLVQHLETAGASAEVLFQSIQALISLSVWSEYNEQLHRALSLDEDGKRVALPEVKTYAGWQAYALGLLVARAPDVYGEAAKQVIEEGGGDAVHLLLQALNRSPVLRKDVAVLLGRSAVDRCARVLGRAFGETDNFEIISRLAPEAFVEKAWEDVWGDWMPQVRCALADSLPTAANTDGIDKSRISKLLTGLLADSTYMVRRSASRSWSRIHLEELNEMCDAWMRSGQTELRIRSAESAQWLAVDNRKSLDNAVIRTLLEDPEPTVRSAAARSAADLRTREWRTFSMGRIRSQHYADPNMLPVLYPYGRALASLGDDETVSSLREMQNQPGLPPAVKNWLRKLADDTEKHWKEVIQKWPDALPAWTGEIEELETSFQVNGQRFTTKISLWRRRQATPSDVITWGGGFRHPSVSDRIRLFAPTAEPLRLIIEGRNPSSIWYNNVSAEGLVSFVGTGPYPYAVQDQL